MSHTVDYYLAPQSPWTYLGHTRFQAIAQQAKVQHPCVANGFGQSVSRLRWSAFGTSAHRSVKRIDWSNSPASETRCKCR